MPNIFIIISQPNSPAAGNTNPGSRDDLVLGQPVTLSNQHNNGISTWLWELVDKPAGSTASLSTPTSPTSGFTPDVIGTYLVKLSANNALYSAVSGSVGAAIKTTNLDYRIPAAFEEEEFDANRGWADAVNDALQKLDDGYGNINSVLTSNVVPSSRQLTAGTGLIGGGDLSNDRSFSLSTFGTPGTYNNITTDSYGRVLSGNLISYAIDNTVVHLAGNENIAGNKSFTGTVSIDGYIINPSNASSGQALVYNGTAFVPTTTAGVGDNIVFAAEANHSVTVANSTTTDANGGNLTLDAGGGNGAGVGGIMSVGTTNASQVIIGNSNSETHLFGYSTYFSAESDHILMVSPSATPNVIGGQLGVFAGDGAPADADNVGAFGGILIMGAGYGGSASSAQPGGNGGATEIGGGIGGPGTPTQPSGAGGNTSVLAGDAGAANGGPGNIGGNLLLDAGIGFGAGNANGVISIGANNATTINIGRNGGGADVVITGDLYANVGLLPAFDITFQGETSPHTIKTGDTTVESNAGADLIVKSGKGGPGTTAVAGVGGKISVIAADGGDETSGNHAGDGGDLEFRAGNSGAGTYGNGGNVIIDAGTTPDPDNATNGSVSIGTSDAFDITIGSGATLFVDNSVSTAELNGGSNSAQIQANSSSVFMNYKTTKLSVVDNSLVQFADTNGAGVAIDLTFASSPGIDLMSSGRFYIGKTNAVNGNLAPAAGGHLVWAPDDIVLNYQNAYCDINAEGAKLQVTGTSENVVQAQDNQVYIASGSNEINVTPTSGLIGDSTATGGFVWNGVSARMVSPYSMTTNAATPGTFDGGNVYTDDDIGTVLSYGPIANGNTTFAVNTHGINASREMSVGYTDMKHQTFGSGRMLDVNGSGYFNGDLTIGNTATLTVGGAIQTNNSGSYDIGSGVAPWRTLYVNNAVIDGYTVQPQIFNPSHLYAVTGVWADVGVPSPLAVGDHIPFDDAQYVGSGITLWGNGNSYSTTNGATSLGRFTLAGGYTYKLVANAGLTTSSSGAASILYKWFDVTNVPTAINGTRTGVGYTDGGAMAFPCSDATAFYSPSSDAIVEVRIVNVSGNFLSVDQSWAMIETILQ